jgi:hypothetical protein
MSHLNRLGFLLLLLVGPAWARDCSEAELRALLDRQVEFVEDAERLAAPAGQAAGAAPRLTVSRSAAARVSREQAEGLLRDAAGTGDVHIIPDPERANRFFLKRGESWYTFERSTLTVTRNGQPVRETHYILRQVSDEIPGPAYEVFTPLTGARIAPPAQRGNEAWQAVLDSARREQLPAADAGPSGAQAAATGPERLFAYHPPKQTRPNELPVEWRRGRKYFRDHWGNLWGTGPSRTRGDAFEWDVQLSPNAPAWMRGLSRDGRHIDVSLSGRISH